MTHTYKYWRTCEATPRTGYSVAEITYTAEGWYDGDTSYYGKERKTLQAAINDGKRYFKKNPDHYVNYYAKAILTDYFDDGTLHHKPYEDCVRVGTLDPNGEYMDMCEQADWL